MNVTVTQDPTGAMIFVPDEVEITSGNSISVTMVPPTSAGWTVESVESRPEETWTDDTAVLVEGEYAISIEASDPEKSGTSNLRVTIGVKEG